MKHTNLVDLCKIVSINDFEEQAKIVMTPNAQSYINSGANSELCLRENVSKFNLVKLNPRALVDVS